jgi:hypothetical protein
MFVKAGENTADVMFFFYLTSVSIVVSAVITGTIIQGLA